MYTQNRIESNVVSIDQFDHIDQRCRLPRVTWSKRFFLFGCCLPASHRVAIVSSYHVFVLLLVSKTYWEFEVWINRTLFSHLQGKHKNEGILLKDTYNFSNLSFCKWVLEELHKKEEAEAQQERSNSRQAKEEMEAGSFGCWSMFLTVLCWADEIDGKWKNRLGSSS